MGLAGRTGLAFVAADIATTYEPLGCPSGRNLFRKFFVSEWKILTRPKDCQTLLLQRYYHSDNSISNSAGEFNFSLMVHVSFCIIKEFKAEECDNTFSF